MYQSDVSLVWECQARAPAALDRAYFSAVYQAAVDARQSGLSLIPMSFYDALELRARDAFRPDLAASLGEVASKLIIDACSVYD